MKKAIFVGEGIEAQRLLVLIMKLRVVKVLFIISEDDELKRIARENNIANCSIEVEMDDGGEADIVIAKEDTGIEGKHVHFEYAWSLIFSAIDGHLLMEKAIDAIEDGMIIVNVDATVQYMNEAAAQMADIQMNSSIGAAIQQLLPSSGLPRVIRTKQPEYNQLQTFANGTTIVTTRMPLIHNGRGTGAIAIFKDVTEATQMAEQITDLRSIQTMLEAIIYSSNDAISVVDEKGTGLMINPAYTKMTGLLPEQIVGKPATTDISEGESIHMQVLQTERPVRGARLKLGPRKQDVVVNVAPVVVDGHLKGSVGVIHDVSELNKITSQLRQAKRKLASLEANYSFDDIVGSSEGMSLAINQAKLGAETSLPILLLGETGTGKELFAHAIHNESERRKQPFVRVNCAALTESLLESELFGYEQGAFSGALRTGKKGLFEEAAGGSIFLDEVGELSQSTQAKLLRVLQEKEIVRVGGTKPIAMDVRVIAATNVDLYAALHEKRFREDLYYRLNKLPIRIPPLRERINDLAPLATYLIQKLNQDFGRNIQSISKLVLSDFQEYDWPGNVRELENVLARAMIYMNLGATELQNVPLPVKKSKNIGSEEIEVNKELFKSNLSEYLAERERDYIHAVLTETKGIKTEAAKRLGISVRSLYYKMEKHQLE
ncbi:sigma-54 interaction domain-containing protein [Shouchella patagoniensis]|uniref:sigma-54 interaction domain-containing protein n=1 Tax=Shouchella patagoniensis TaxID=228576 RepID=UPI001FE87593|nr:sigma-54-dependent Fis family transcriptional regulator [Shouchella patagoniensis]